MKKKKIDLITLFISIAALLIAGLSYKNSLDALSFEKDRVTREKSPGIILKSDSTAINFSVDKENARLQTVILRIPDAVSPQPLLAYGHEKKVSIKDLESIFLNYFEKRVLQKDSLTIVGEVRIPVVIDYEVVLEREARMFREDYFLVFIISSEAKNTKVQFNHSVFNYKLGIPLETHYFFKLPFTDVSPEKIRSSDIKDLKNYLDNRFDQTIDYFTYKGLLR